MCSKAFSRIIFSVIFRAFNHQLVDKKIKTEILLKLSNLNSNLALTLGYLNPALNNSAQEFKVLILSFAVFVVVASGATVYKSGADEKKVRRQTDTF